MGRRAIAIRDPQSLGFVIGSVAFYGAGLALLFQINKYVFLPFIVFGIIAATGPGGTIGRLIGTAVLHRSRSTKQLLGCNEHAPAEQPTLVPAPKTYAVETAEEKRAVVDATIVGWIVSALFAVLLYFRHP